MATSDSSQPPAPPPKNVRFPPNHISISELDGDRGSVEDPTIQVDTVDDEQPKAIDNESEEWHGPRTSQPPSKRAKIRSLGRRTKERTKELLRHEENFSSDSEEDAHKAVTRQLHEDPAFNPGQLMHNGPPRIDGLSSSPKKALKNVASAIVHPKDTIKEKMTRTAAGKLSGAQRPYLSPEQDREFLEAHDNLSKVASQRDSRNVSEYETDELEEKARNDVDKLEEHRQSLKTGWTTGRHIDRVRVVHNILGPFPDKEFFVERDESGNYVRYQWEKYIGYILLYHSQCFTTQYIDDFNDLPFDIDTLARTVERLVMASAPWQAWYMSVRRVYRWEDPRRTAKWFALFAVLWYTEHIVGFFYAYVIFIILKERYSPSSVESVRESLDHVLNRSAKAYQWGDLVDKHGRDKWLDPLLDELGPYLQLQLGDLADLAEVLTHFYYWSAPKKTAASLFFFFSCLLVTLLSDMRFCVKIVLFICVGSFFVCWPISSNYPKYRYLMSPLRWVLWEIPTNAEWSLEQLRQKARLQLQDIDVGRRKRSEPTHKLWRLMAWGRFPKPSRKRDIETESASGSDEEFVTPPSSPKLPPTTGLFGYLAISHGRVGRFIIDRDGVRFHHHGFGTEWKIFFIDLVELRKTRPSQTAKMASLGSEVGRIELFFTNKQGNELMEKVDIKEGRRDEVFNVIIGWSDLRWRSLQLSRASVKEDGQRTTGPQDSRST